MNNNRANLISYRVLTTSEAMTNLSDTLREGLDQLVSTGRNIPLDWDLDTLGTHSADEIIVMLIQRLSKGSKNQKPIHGDTLPKTIFFPYSRHSSLPELCHFVDAFRPKDVWPCTVSPIEWLKKGMDSWTPSSLICLTYARNYCWVSVRTVLFRQRF